MPEWTELIKIQQWDGFCKRSIAASIALHSNTECDVFANLLLRDPLLVQSTRRDKPSNDGFILAVLTLWHSKSGSAVPYMWNDFIDCMKGAGLDKDMIKIVEDHTCWLLHNTISTSEYNNVTDSRVIIILLCNYELWKCIHKLFYACSCYVH